MALAKRKGQQKAKGRAPADVADICSTVALSCLSQSININSTIHFHICNTDLKQLPPGGLVRERDINALFEAPPHGFIQVPGEVGGGQHHDHVGLGRRVVVGLLFTGRQTLNLCKELALDAPSRKGVSARCATASWHARGGFRV